MQPTDVLRSAASFWLPVASNTTPSYTCLVRDDPIRSPLSCGELHVRTDGENGKSISPLALLPTLAVYMKILLSRLSVIPVEFFSCNAPIELARAYCADFSTFTFSDGTRDQHSVPTFYAVITFILVTWLNGFAGDMDAILKRLVAGSPSPLGWSASQHGSKYAPQAGVMPGDDSGCCLAHAIIESASSHIMKAT